MCAVGFLTIGKARVLLRWHPFLTLHVQLHTRGRFWSPPIDFLTVHTAHFDLRPNSCAVWHRRGRAHRLVALLALARVLMKAAVIKALTRRMASSLNAVSRPLVMADTERQDFRRANASRRCRKPGHQPRRQRRDSQPRKTRTFTETKHQIKDESLVRLRPEVFRRLRIGGRFLRLALAPIPNRSRTRLPISSRWSSVRLTYSDQAIGGHP